MMSETHQDLVAEVEIRGDYLGELTPELREYRIGFGCDPDRPVIPPSRVLAEIAEHERRGVRVLLVTLECNGDNGQVMLDVYRALRRFARGGLVVVHAVGYNASSSPVIASAAQYVLMAPGACFVLHSAGRLEGKTPYGLENAKQGQAKINELMLGLFFARTFAPRELLSDWLSRTENSEGKPSVAVLDTATAVHLGFADKVATREEALAFAGALARGLPGLVAADAAELDGIERMRSHELAATTAYIPAGGDGYQATQPVTTSTVPSSLDAVNLGIAVGTPVVGNYSIDELQATQLKAIGRKKSGSGLTLTVDKTWYRGSIVEGTLQGAPNISCLTVTAQTWDTTSFSARWDFKLQPSAADGSDNLDALRYAKVELYRQSVAGSSGALTSIGTFYVKLPDRLYKVPATDSDTGNLTIVTATFIDSAQIQSGFPLGRGAAIITLYNVNGPSVGNCFYTPAGWTGGTNLVNNGTSFPAGLTGGGSGGSGGGGSGGGGCLDPTTPVLIAPGRLLPLGLLGVGDLVWTRPESGGELGFHRVEKIRHTSNLRCRVTLRDGRDFICSINHLLNVRGIWLRADSLQAGEELQGDPGGHVRRVEYLGEGPVVQLSIPSARTYFAGDGVFHHNTLKV